MGMLSRFARIWKADIHGVMDEFEDKGLVLKQSLRDMEDELEKKEMFLQQLQASREQAGRKYDAAVERGKKLEKDLESGLAGGHDRICLGLIRRIKEEERVMQALDEYREELAREIRNLQEVLDRQRRQYQESRARTREYFLKEEQRSRRDTFAGITGDHFDSSFVSVSDEEVELELMRRKAAMETSEVRP